MSKVPLKALGTEIANNEKSTCPLPTILCSQCHFPGALAIAKMLLVVTPCRVGSTGRAHHTGRAVCKSHTQRWRRLTGNNLGESHIPEGVDRKKNILKRKLHCAPRGSVASNSTKSRWHHVGGWPGNR